MKLNEDELYRLLNLLQQAEDDIKNDEDMDVNELNETKSLEKKIKKEIEKYSKDINK